MTSPFCYLFVKKLLHLSNAAKNRMGLRVTLLRSCDGALMLNVKICDADKNTNKIARKEGRKQGRKCPKRGECILTFIIDLHAREEWSQSLHYFITYQYIS